MQCMLKDDTYNKVKILQSLSSLEWFIKKHAISDAKEAQDKEMEELLKKLCKDLEGHIKAVEQVYSA